MTLSPQPDPLDQLLELARRASLDGADPTEFANWPFTIGRDMLQSIGPAIGYAIETTMRSFRDDSGAQLADAVMRVQALACFLRMDKEQGALLGAWHERLAAMIRECSDIVVDDVAAELIAEAREQIAYASSDQLPVVTCPIGRTRLAAVAADLKWQADNEYLTDTIRQVHRLQHFEPEMAFDGGRPSERLMAKFAERLGQLELDNQSNVQVQATLEEDWRVSVQFQATESDSVFYERIDRVRIGARAVEPVDEEHDLWVTSLAQLDLDAQTRLVNQPIVIELRTGERFAL